MSISGMFSPSYFFSVPYSAFILQYLLMRACTCYHAASDNILGVSSAKHTHHPSGGHVRTSDDIPGPQYLCAEWHAPTIQAPTIHAASDNPVTTSGDTAMHTHLTTFQAHNIWASSAKNLWRHGHHTHPMTFQAHNICVQGGMHPLSCSI